MLGPPAPYCFVSEAKAGTAAVFVGMSDGLTDAPVAVVQFLDSRKGDNSADRLDRP